MFNTLPSNSVGGDGSTSGGSSLTPRGFPPLAPAQVYADVQTYFDNSDAAQIAKFGPRYQWASLASPLDTTWVNLVDLTGPGVMQFLAFWEITSGESKAFNLRVVVDGTIVINIPLAWTGTVDIDEGYIPIGDVQWDDSLNIPLDPPIGLETMTYNSRFLVQMNCTSGSASANSSFKAIYRHYDTQ